MNFTSIIESCNIRPQLDKVNAIDFSYILPKKLKPYDVIFVNTNCLKFFIQTVMSRIKTPFILVSGLSDKTTPEDTIGRLYLHLITNSQLVHWFCQNCSYTHPKITIIPMGMSITDKPIEYKPFTERNIQDAFIICEHSTLDSHHIWDALSVGCIPIVKINPVNTTLLSELPVLLVQDFIEVTTDLLASTLEKFISHEFNNEKLKSSYWIDLIKSYKNKN